MRNLKRVLSLALALVMVLGMMVITTSAATYTDADEITYTEAVDVMSALGAFKGDNGALKPTEILTRKEAAVLVARIILGEKMAESLVPTKQLFDDVAVDAWYAAEVEYCNNIGMIVGHDGKFNPDGKLTGTAFAKLLLCAMGYDAAAQGYEGAKWDSNVNADAVRAGLTIKGVNINAELTREQAAQMLFQALNGEMVKYRTSYDYATGANVLVGPFETGETFASEYYPTLKKVSGIINEVNYYYGSTSFNGVEVRQSGADYNNIGYAGYVWALPGGAENTRYLTAISDIVVTGTSMGVSTNGADIDTLTDSYDSDYIGFIDEAGCDVYYNGKKVGTITLNYKYEVVADAATEAKLALADKVGVKVEFIDNDNQGKAEAIAITEYTFAAVTGLKKISESGDVSLAYYQLDNGTQIKPAKLVGPDALSVGDYVTYVNYYGNYLTNVLDVAVAELESITRNKLHNESVTVYTIDGEGYINSDLVNGNALTRADINGDVVYVLDQYGYIVLAADYTDPDAYLYVVNNNHTDYLEGLTKTAVVFADGTADYVYVSKIVGDAAGIDYDNGDIAQGIYSYVLDRNGNYVLTKQVTADVVDAAYETYDLYFGDANEIAVKYATIVDLRKDTFGEVYTGYTELPDMVNGKIVYLASAKLGYLVDGTDPVNLKAEFVVFDTTFNVEDIVSYYPTTYTYTLEEGVLVRGELKTNYVLSEAQKAVIAEKGVGAYAWGVDGKLTFTPFTSGTIQWTPENSGTLIKNNKDVTDDYTAIFLNLQYGEVNYWEQLVQPGTYYCIYDETVRTDKIVYIVADATKPEIDEYLEETSLTANKATVVAEYGKVIDAIATPGSGWTTESVAAAKAAVEEAVKDMTADEVAALNPAVGNWDAFWMTVVDPIFQAAKDNAAATTATSTRGTILDCVTKANPTATTLSIILNNYKFDESMKVVLYTAEGKEIGSVAAVPNSHSVLLTGVTNSTSCSWKLDIEKATSPRWTQTGTADYLNVPSYATLFIDGEAVESVLVGFSGDSGVDPMTKEAWYTWLDAAL